MRRWETQLTSPFNATGDTKRVSRATLGRWWLASLAFFGTATTLAADDLVAPMPPPRAGVTAMQNPPQADGPYNSYGPPATVDSNNLPAPPGSNMPTPSPDGPELGPPASVDEANLPAPPPRSRSTDPATANPNSLNALATPTSAVPYSRGAAMGYGASAYHEGGMVNSMATPPAVAPTKKQRKKSALQTIFSWGYRSEFDQPPAGASVHAMMSRQVNNAKAARCIMYEYDFCHCGAELSPRGRLQLWRISERALCLGHPVFIEPNFERPELDQARRNAVIAELSARNIAIPPEQVMIAVPPSRGLSGEEAVLVNLHMLRETREGKTDVNQAQVFQPSQNVLKVNPRNLTRSPTGE